MFPHFLRTTKKPRRAFLVINMSDQIEDFALFLSQYFDATEQDLFHIGQVHEIIEAAKVEWLRLHSKR